MDRAAAAVPGAEDRNAAASWARSTESTSITIQPAIRSLVSANGPSVTGGFPSPSNRTNVPSGESAWPSTYSPRSRRVSATWSMKARWAEISSGVHWSIGTSSCACRSGPPR